MEFLFPMMMNFFPYSINCATYSRNNEKGGLVTTTSHSLSNSMVWTDAVRSSRSHCLELLRSCGGIGNCFGATWRTAVLAIHLLITPFKIAYNPSSDFKLVTTTSHSLSSSMHSGDRKSPFWDNSVFTPASTSVSFPPSYSSL